MSTTSTFQLTGLHCESCKKITEKRVGKIEGVNTVVTEVETGKLTIEADRDITKQEVALALSGTEYIVN